ncbi:MAG: hypothetical protein M5R40_01330 [Anaerolineae bacterium]|nr:hypothetical protein [Anaerolineae bacterium]
MAASVMGVVVDVVGYQAFFLLMLAPMVFGLWRLRSLHDPSAR